MSLPVPHRVKFRPGSLERHFRHLLRSKINEETVLIGYVGDVTALITARNLEMAQRLITGATDGALRKTEIVRRWSRPHVLPNI